MCADTNSLQLRRRVLEGARGRGGPAGDASRIGIRIAFGVLPWLSVVLAVLWFASMWASRAIACDKTVPFRGKTFDEWRELLERRASGVEVSSDELNDAYNAVVAFGPAAAGLESTLRRILRNGDLTDQLVACSALAGLKVTSQETLALLGTVLSAVEADEVSVSPELGLLLMDMALRGVPGAVQSILASVGGGEGSTATVRIGRLARLSSLGRSGIRVDRDPLGVLTQIAEQRSHEWIWLLVGIMPNLTSDEIRLAIVAQARRRLSKSEDNDSRLPLLLVVLSSGERDRSVEEECREGLRALLEVERIDLAYNSLATEIGREVLIPWLRPRVIAPSKSSEASWYAVDNYDEVFKALLPELVQRAVVDRRASLRIVREIRRLGAVSAAIQLSKAKEEDQVPALAWRALLASVDRELVSSLKPEIEALARDLDPHHRADAAEMLKWLSPDIPWVASTLSRLACDEESSEVRVAAR